MVNFNSYPGPRRPMLAAQLRQASEATHDYVFTCLRESGFADLRQSHFDLFRFPGPHGVTPTQLANHVGLSKQALNPLLKELENWGYLTRVHDQKDRRRRTLQLSARGLELVTAIREALENLETRTRTLLGATRFEDLLEAISEIRSMAGSNKSMDPN